jgi:hypothetical protein
MGFQSETMPDYMEPKVCFCVQFTNIYHREKVSNKTFGQQTRFVYKNTLSEPPNKNAYGELRDVENKLTTALSTFSKTLFHRIDLP